MGRRSRRKLLRNEVRYWVTVCGMKDLYIHGNGAEALAAFGDMCKYFSFVYILYKRVGEGIESRSWH